MHFETIWNEAESVSKSYTKLSRKDIFKNIRTGIDDLSDADEAQDYHQALGDVLFDLCALLAHLEDKKGLQINSASALNEAIDRRRAQLLDPEPPNK